MQKRRVLVADDIKIMRALLKSNLATYNCEVVAQVENGNEVIENIKKFKPHLVFLDINMPGKNGLEVLKEIKSQFDSIFVAMVSGHNTFENIKQATDLGADGFVVKPFTSVKIKEMIDKYRARREPVR
ncbi:MAG: response regulator [Gammaproteobacteria bacterium]|nr:response regulator [Gammaproteobacteria bacterium]